MIATEYVGGPEECTHHHAEADFLSSLLLFDSLVQDNVQEDVVQAQVADGLATAVELDEQALVETLCEGSARSAEFACDEHGERV